MKAEHLTVPRTENDFSSQSPRARDILMNGWGDFLISPLFIAKDFSVFWSIDIGCLTQAGHLKLERINGQTAYVDYPNADVELLRPSVI